MNLNSRLPTGIAMPATSNSQNTISRGTKLGVPPPITQDSLYYFYRIHSLNLVAPNDIPVTQIHGDIADVIYNTLLLTAPAQLNVQSGTHSVTYSLGAGLQQVRTPFAPGTQTFTLLRNGAPVLSVQGAPIMSSITNYDYFPASGYAYGLAASEKSGRRARNESRLAP